MSGNRRNLPPDCDLSGSMQKKLRFDNSPRPRGTERRGLSHTTPRPQRKRIVVLCDEALLIIFKFVYDDEFFEEFDDSAAGKPDREALSSTLPALALVNRRFYILLSSTGYFGRLASSNMPPAVLRAHMERIRDTGKSFTASLWYRGVKCKKNFNEFLRRISPVAHQMNTLSFGFYYQPDNKKRRKELQGFQKSCPSLHLPELRSMFIFFDDTDSSDEDGQTVKYDSSSWYSKFIMPNLQKVTAYNVIPELPNVTTLTSLDITAFPSHEGVLSLKPLIRLLKQSPALKSLQLALWTYIIPEEEREPSVFLGANIRLPELTYFRLDDSSVDNDYVENVYAPFMDAITAPKLERVELVLPTEFANSEMMARILRPLQASTALTRANFTLASPKNHLSDAPVRLILDKLRFLEHLRIQSGGLGGYAEKPNEVTVSCTIYLRHRRRAVVINGECITGVVFQQVIEKLSHSSLRGKFDSLVLAGPMMGAIHPNYIRWLERASEAKLVCFGDGDRSYIDEWVR